MEAGPTGAPPGDCDPGPSRVLLAAKACPEVGTAAVRAAAAVKAAAEFAANSSA